MQRIRCQSLIKKKKDSIPITMLTAYDVMTAEILSDTGVDIILVGDSLGNVFCGYDTTLPVTLDNMIYHTQAVVRGNRSSFIVSDMPFLSYQVSIEQAKENAGRLIKEGGAHGVKLEVGTQQLETVKAILGMGVPVMAHLGFTPQSVHQLGGYRIQGRDQDQVDQLIALAVALDEMGCFSVLLEMIPGDVAKQITHTINVPTIGIGAGLDCDGQVLVTQDLWGMSKQTPRFVKHYAKLRETMTSSVSDYIQEVTSRQFPDPDHCYD